MGISTAAIGNSHVPVAPLDDGTAPQPGRAAYAARSSASTAARSRGWSAWTLATDGSNLSSYDHAAKRLELLLTCPVCETEKVIHSLA
jgi:hypothetical protein